MKDNWIWSKFCVWRNRWTHLLIHWLLSVGGRCKLHILKHNYIAKLMWKKTIYQSKQATPHHLHSVETASAPKHLVPTWHCGRIQKLQFMKFSKINYHGFSIYYQIPSLSWLGPVWFLYFWFDFPNFHYSIIYLPSIQEEFTFILFGDFCYFYTCIFLSWK